MHRHFRTLFHAYLLVGLLCCGAVTAQADTADELLTQALAQARAGQSAEFQQTLSKVLEINPQHRLAHSLLGEIRQGSSWFKLDESMKKTSAQPALSEYEHLRNSSEPNVKSLLKLADYCRAHRLEDQERAHLIQILELSPSHNVARNRLGYHNVSGTWYSREQIEAAQDRRAQSVKAQSQWSSKVESIRLLMQAKDSKRFKLGVVKLGEIDDSTAIPLFEQRLGVLGDLACFAIIDHLQKSPEHAATVALCRYALLAPWQEVNDRAATALRERNHDIVVPIILAELHSPAQVQSSIYTNTRGEMILRQEIFREEQEHRERMTVEQKLDNPLTTLTPTLGTSETEQAEQAKVKLASQVEARNQKIADENKRVLAALRTITQTDLGEDPLDWWSWWNEVSEVYIAEDKSTAERYARVQSAAEKFAAEESARIRAEARREQSFRRRFRRDCLAAGTLVTTSSGLRPIETLRVGDLVLSQHPRTGEIALKPVLRTTVRPPSPLCQLTVDGETFRSSGGHPFWVLDAGWQRARNLEAAQLLVGLGRVAAITSAADTDETEATYNLVVADHHNYFIGQSRLLSHDNTACEPTAVALPGFAK